MNFLNNCTYHFRLSFCTTRLFAGMVMAGLSAAVLNGLAAQQASPQTFDLLIQHGRVYDGTGNPWFPADIGVRDGRVLFRYRMPATAGMDRTRQGITSLSVDEFLGRLLEHVPPRRFQTVRGYGLYSGNQHSRLDQAYRALGRVPPEQKPPLSWQELCEQAGHAEAGKCPVCGQALIAHRHFERGRSPPRLASLSLSAGKGAA